MQDLEFIFEKEHISNETGIEIRKGFVSFLDYVMKNKELADSIIVTDASQKEEMQKAHDIRLDLKRIRVDADKKRKEMKEESLRYGKAVQAVYNYIEEMITPIEKHLEAQEKFVEIQEANAKAELKAKREAEIAEYRDYFPFLNQLDIISEPEYKSACEMAIKRKADAEQQARDAEAFRLEQERQREENERKLREENARLRKENAEKAENERIEKEKRIAAERRAQIAEQNARNPLQGGFRTKTTASDSEKMVALAESIEAIIFPELSDPWMQGTLKNIRAVLQDITKTIRTEAQRGMKKAV